MEDLPSGEGFGFVTGLTSATKTRFPGLLFPPYKSPMTRQVYVYHCIYLGYCGIHHTHTLYIIKVAGMASSLVLERDASQRNRVYVEYLLLRKSIRHNRPPLANIRRFNNAII